MSAITLSELKNALNILDSVHDAEIQEFLDAATVVVTYYAGPIASTQFVETHNVAGRTRIILDNPPIISVDSVVEYVGYTSYTLTAQPPGTTTNNYGYSLDLPEAGLLVRRDGSGSEIGFFGSPVVVTYTAGRAVISPDLRRAIIEDARAAYQQTQQGGRRGAQTVDTYTDPGTHLFPRLMAMLESSQRTQAIG